MANNDQIFNAVLAGAGGSSQERWLTSVVSSSYDEFVSKVVDIANAVDAEIAPTTIDIGERSLMQAIAQGVFSGRFPNVTTYDQIAESIVQLYTALAAELFPEGGGGGGGSTDTVTNDSRVPGATATDALNNLFGSPVNTYNEVSHTMLAADIGAYVRINFATACEFVIPSFDDLPDLEIGDALIIEAAGAGQLTITSVDAVIHSARSNILIAQYSVVSLKCTALDTWTIMGDLEAL
jgi:hypothetical protein